MLGRAGASLARLFELPLVFTYHTSMIGICIAHLLGRLARGMIGYARDYRCTPRLPTTVIRKMVKECGEKPVVAIPTGIYQERFRMVIHFFQQNFNPV